VSTPAETVASARIGVAAPGTGRAGRLELVFGETAGRTGLVHAYAEAPFRITPLFHPAGPSLAHFMLVQTTAGLFGGDRTDVDIRVQRGARVVVTSQAALQAHPSADRTSVARQRLRAVVEDGGELHAYLDPLIPFAGARVRQITCLEVTGAGRLFWSDGLMAGRVRRGERWQFARLDVETALRRDGVLVHLERFSLGEGPVDPTARWAMGAHPYLGSLLACDARLDETRGDALQAALFEAGRPKEEAGALLGGVDLPAPGLLAGRVTAADGASFRRWQRAWRTAVFETLLDQIPPPLRP